MKIPKYIALGFSKDGRVVASYAGDRLEAALATAGDLISLEAAMASGSQVPGEPAQVSGEDLEGVLIVSPNAAPVMEITFPVSEDLAAVLKLAAKEEDSI